MAPAGTNVMEGHRRSDVHRGAKLWPGTGTTSFVATTVTASPDDTCRSRRRNCAFTSPNSLRRCSPKLEVLGVSLRRSVHQQKARRGVPSRRVGTNCRTPNCCSDSCKLRLARAPHPDPSRLSCSGPSRAFHAAREAGNCRRHGATRMLPYEQAPRGKIAHGARPRGPCLQPLLRPFLASRWDSGVNRRAVLHFAGGYPPS